MSDTVHPLNLKDCRPEPIRAAGDDSTGLLHPRHVASVRDGQYVSAYVCPGPCAASTDFQRLFVLKSGSVGLYTTH